MTWPFTAGLLLAACAAYAQPQRDLNCDTAPDDPRCQALSRYSTQQPMRNELPSVPRIPVIRDQAAPGQVRERSPQTEQRITEPSAYSAPADPPTEFQEFVEHSTGRLLPLFGRDLFRGVPSTFAPADRVPVTPEYMVGPGDELVVRGWGQIDLNVTPVVDRAGAVYIPQVGALTVAGLRFAQVQDYLKTAISRVYHNFDLSVTMGQLRSIQVLVTGHARRPGAYTISALSTLVNAIFASGGPDSRGSMRHIRLTRLGEPVREFDLYDLLLAGDKSKDVRLLPGDVIHIPPAGPQVAITGSVNTPAVYELGGATTLADGLRIAGGLTPVAARQRALIERIQDSSRGVLEVPLDDIDRASSVPLRNGDIVKILAIVPRFENTVTLRGNVADPVRVPWRPGMRIRDLIPDREALLTRDYWRTRNQLVFDEERRKPDTMDTGAGDLRLPDSAVVRMPGNPGEADGSAVIPAMARRMGGQRSTRVPDQAVTAERTTPGAIAGPRPETLVTAANHIERNPLEVNWSYAVIERRNPKDLRTTLVPFNLGKAILDGVEADNVPLEPGDIVTVFSTADLKVPRDEQTRYVRLEGEFASAGVYSVQPGETLRKLVQRAGGLTQQAYLFGSEFVRQSSRVEQQQRLDDLVNSLEQQATSAAANMRGSVISAEEAAAANSQIEGQRELIQKLRQVRATGRIVLDLDPRQPGVAGLPELPLENGDVFTVPGRPAFVNVIGAIYNPTSFLYREDKRLGDYLRESGGPTRTGDARHTFLIRADGSVVSKSWGNGLFTRSFEGLPLNPGDTVVVPEQINKTTFLKGLKDWSQVFAQFALGAAAVNILR